MWGKGAKVERAREQVGGGERELEREREKERERVVEGRGTKHKVLREQNLQLQRVPVPDEKKDIKYWERRRKNNEAAKKSRNLRRKKMDDELKSAKDAVSENQKLKQEIDVSHHYS